MSTKVRKILTLILFFVFLVSMIAVIRQLFDYKKSNEAQQNAQNIAMATHTSAQQTPKATATPQTVSSAEPSVTPAPQKNIEPNLHETELLKMDLNALREINEEVVGWISIPDTVISYPITQAEDNDYYLDHSWDLERNAAGAIFLEHLVSPDFTDFNTLIYGHRMNNGSMFTSLKNYRTIEYWQEHPNVYILTDDGVSCYKVYAAYVAEVDEVTYGLDLESEALRQYFIDHGLAYSIIDTGIVPTTDDLAITLVSCTGRGYSSRWVVQAVLDHTIARDTIAE